MTKQKKYPSQERLKELFNYVDGELIRKVTVTSRANVGDVAGCINKSTGYHRTSVDSVRCQTHRLIFIFHHGFSPENDIDHHPDRTRLNNRIENLRESTRSCNLRNTGNRCTNTSGVKGVSWDKRSNKWKSGVKVMGNPKHLGLHDDFNEAVLYRLAAEQCLNWEGCDSSSPAFKYVQEMLGK